MAACQKKTFFNALGHVLSPSHLPRRSGRVPAGCRPILRRARGYMQHVWACKRWPRQTDWCQSIYLRLRLPSGSLKSTWACSSAPMASLPTWRRFAGSSPTLAPSSGLGWPRRGGVPVVAHGLPSGSYADRVIAAMRTSRGREGVLRDTDDLIVEDLGLPMNLMLSHAVTPAVDAADALKQLAKLLAASASSCRRAGAIDQQPRTKVRRSHRSAHRAQPWGTWRGAGCCRTRMPQRCWLECPGHHHAEHVDALRSAGKGSRDEPGFCAASRTLRPWPATSGVCNRSTGGLAR